MTDTNVLFDNAELALAAYAHLNNNDPVLDQKESLKAAGMTEEQAIQFAVRWPEVVTQYNDPVLTFLSPSFVMAMTLTLLFVEPFPLILISGIFGQTCS